MIGESGSANQTECARASHEGRSESGDDGMGCGVAQSRNALVGESTKVDAGVDASESSRLDRVEITPDPSCGV